MNQQKRTGIFFIAFPIVLQIPFTFLSMIYNYPDILREPPNLILQSFREGGMTLILAWYAYALSILVFFAGLLSYKPVSLKPRLASAIRFVGFLSATLQMIALLRWTFIVPILSRLYAEAPSAASREMIETIFTVQHQFLGVALGEHLGQLSLAVWTILMVRDHAGSHRVFQVLGAASALILSLGLVEHLAEVFDYDAGIFAHGALIGFLLWSIWLISVGVRLVRGHSPTSPGT